MLAKNIVLGVTMLVFASIAAAWLLAQPKRVTTPSPRDILNNVEVFCDSKLSTLVVENKLSVSLAKVRLAYQDVKDDRYIVQAESVGPSGESSGIFQPTSGAGPLRCGGSGYSISFRIDKTWYVMVTDTVTKSLSRGDRVPY